MKRTYTKEADVKAEIKKILVSTGWFFWMPPGNGYGTSGVSDFNAIKWKSFLAVEAKFGSNKPTPMQLRYLREVNERGFPALVVNERNLDEFREFCQSWQHDHPLDYVDEALRP